MVLAMSGTAHSDRTAVCAYGGLSSRDFEGVFMLVKKLAVAQSTDLINSHQGAIKAGGVF